MAESRLAMRFASNRSLINQMKEWGWVQTGKKGDRWRMVYLDGSHVNVMAPQTHESNDSLTFKSVIQTTCNGDLTRFWEGPTKDEKRQITKRLLERMSDKAAKSAPIEILEPVVAGPRPARAVEPSEEPEQSEWLEVADEAAAIGFAHEDEPVVEPERVEEPQPQERVMTSGKYGNGRGTASANRGAMARVLVMLIDSNGRPVTAYDVERVLGYPKGTASGALGRLQRLGFAERLAHGQYKAVDRLLRDQIVRHHAERGSIDLIQVHLDGTPEPAKVEPERVPEPVAEPAPEPAQPAPEAQVVPLHPEPPIAPPVPLRPVEQPQELPEISEETIEAVLDLLIPGGFKARHLAAVEAWVQATRRLIKAVES